MASILGTRQAQSGVVIEVLASPDELRQLRGEMEDIQLFSQRVATIPTKVSLRGRNEATKYFLIPRQLRRHLAVRGQVSCQRLDAKGKSMFIYVLQPEKSGNDLLAEH